MNGVLNTIIFSFFILASCGRDRSTIKSVNNSDALVIGYTFSNDLLLRATSCGALIKQHVAICNWRKSLDSDFVVPTITSDHCKTSAKNAFKMTVSACLPQFVKDNFNKKLYHNGANCWGTAMNFKKISTVPRFIWSKEMSYWLNNTPLCRKLEIGEAKEPGDIISTYGPEYNFEAENPADPGIQFWQVKFPGRNTTPYRGYTGFHHMLHSETYLTDRLTFGKDSPNKDDRFKFNHLNQVYGRSQDPKCQENQSLTPYFREYQNPPKAIKDSACDYFSLTYRCEDFEGYLARQALSPSEDKVNNTIKELQTIQHQLFQIMVNKNKQLSNTFVQSILTQSDRIAQDSLVALSTNEFTKNSEMLLVLQFFSAAAIRKTIQQADYAN